MLEISYIPVTVLAGKPKSNIYDRKGTENNGNDVSNNHLNILFLIIIVVLQLDECITGYELPAGLFNVETSYQR